MKTKVQIKNKLNNISNLFFIRWTNIRNEWYFHLLIIPLIPVLILVFLNFMGIMDDLESSLHLLTGNAILSIVFGPFQSLSKDFSLSKERKDFDFLAMLPIKKSELILSYSMVSLLSVIPSLFIILLLGKFWLNLDIYINIFVIITIILSAFSLIGLGTIIGVISKGIHHANVLSSFAVLIFTFISPTLVSYDRLPLVLKGISKLIPTTYAVDAFRLALQNNINNALLFNIGILIVFTLFLMYLATNKMEWRS